MTALGENRIGVLSDGGSIPLTSTKEKAQTLLQSLSLFLYCFLPNASDSADNQATNIRSNATAAGTVTVSFPPWLINST